MITTNACEDILLGWSDGQIIDNMSKRYGFESESLGCGDIDAPAGELRVRRKLLTNGKFKCGSFPPDVFVRSEGRAPRCDMPPRCDGPTDMARIWSRTTSRSPVTL